jgi:hypothetical protein
MQVPINTNLEYWRNENPVFDLKLQLLTEQKCEGSDMSVSFHSSFPQQLAAIEGRIQLEFISSQCSNYFALTQTEYFSQ